MKNLRNAGVMLLALILLAACGPSPEQSATMTAAAWTPTPVPPTPVPYGLSLTVTGSDGAPVAGASVAFPESGSGEPVLTNDQGSYQWTDLPGDSASLSIYAQGYITSQKDATLQRGPNEISIELERDPYGLLPSTACAAGETLKHLEDFQDGFAQDFTGFEQNPGLQLGTAPGEDGNTVLILDGPKAKPDEWLGSNLNWNKFAFGDAVWRLRFMVNASTWVTFNWNEHGPSEFDGQEVNATVYNFMFRGSPANTVSLVRNVFQPSGEPFADKSGQFASGTFTMIPGQWHFAEISQHQGHLQLWIDGKSEVDYQDPNPLPAGSIGAWSGGPFSAGETDIIYLDAYSVCGLSAPFTSIASPIPVPAP